MPNHQAINCDSVLWQKKFTVLASSCHTGIAAGMLVWGLLSLKHREYCLWDVMQCQDLFFPAHSCCSFPSENNVITRVAERKRPQLSFYINTGSELHLTVYLQSFTLLSESKMEREDSLSTFMIHTRFATMLRGSQHSCRRKLYFKKRYSWWCKQTVASSVKSEHRLLNSNISLTTPKKDQLFH